MTFYFRCALLLLLFEGLWLLFVFQISASELIAGAVASALTFVSAAVALRSIPFEFRPRAKWLLPVWRLPGMIVGDVVLLVKHLFRPARSTFENVPLRTSAEPFRVSAQRSLAVILVSTSPNTFVVDVVEEQQEMIIHKLEPQGPSKLVEELQGS